MRPAMKRRAGFSGSFNGPGAVPRTIDIGAINAPSGHIWLEWCSDKISRNFGEIAQVDNKMERKSARSDTKSCQNRRFWRRLVIVSRVAVPAQSRCADEPAAYRGSSLGLSEYSNSVLRLTLDSTN
ncbi:hypothetical protein N2600_15930 [Rhizobium sp. WSM1274]|uniref:hypothetical protein n=1 Tax=Rhizobium sp. WSM1274 TaxID=3138254 RepID=UPI0021A87805|nr:hypothetical protein [Rhizobium leguminosarum]UWU26877.1 hypothetical protein N2600_15930 [Rhizobium leguminosarum bv. viciae]